MKCGAIRGRFRGESKNYNLDALRLMASHSSMSPENISKEIALKDVYHYKTILASLCNENKKINGFHYLLNKEYLKCHNLEDSFEESELEITYKGLFTILHFSIGIFNRQESEHARRARIWFNFNFESDRLEPCHINYSIVENIDTLHELYDFLKKLIPVKLIVYIWMDQIETKYIDKDIDDIPLKVFIQEFYHTAQKILYCLTAMLLAEGKIPVFYLSENIEGLTKQILSWIDEEEGKIISEKLLEDSLSSEIELTKYELKIASLTFKLDFLELRTPINGDELNISIFKRRKGAPNYNLHILKTLLQEGPLFSIELTKIISDKESIPLSNVKSRLSHRKSGKLKDLHEKEYIYWPSYNKKYDRSPINITLKGIYAVLCNASYSERTEYIKKVEYNFDIPKLPLESIKIPVGTLMDTDYFELYLKMILPLKPIIYFWLETIKNKFAIRELDNIKLEDIKQVFTYMAERILQIVVYLLVKDNVLKPYFENEINKSIDNLHQWIDNHNPNENISKELLTDRLKSRKKLTDFEKRILDIYPKWPMQTSNGQS